MLAVMMQGKGMSFPFAPPAAGGEEQAHTHLDPPGGAAGLKQPPQVTQDKITQDKKVVHQEKDVTKKEHADGDVDEVIVVDDAKDNSDRKADKGREDNDNNKPKEGDPSSDDLDDNQQKTDEVNEVATI